MLMAVVQQVADLKMCGLTVAGGVACAGAAWNPYNRSFAAVVSVTAVTIRWAFLNSLMFTASDMI